MEANADERDTRGFISITRISPLSGLTGPLSRGPTVGAAARLGIAASRLAPRRARAAQKPVSANEKIVLGLIGCGGMGAVNMRTLMGKPGVEVAALCDVDESRIPRDAADVERKYGRKPAMQTRRHG